ncbi:hypothetical protein B0H39_000412 [Clostridium beijerinckii]|uniref:hypothetical protein n=1 Tax=Clostridium beijerinckii TaxID=1520 RepID=UPI001F4BE2B3|nr:hypothetical protein [Clostridium beijerinckii]NOW82531.1 hypothetical protein [Clostridium beijerinckii]
MYRNFEILHECCYDQHRKLLLKYGGNKQLGNIRKFFNNIDVEPSSKTGIRIMREQFQKFEYNC